MRSPDIHADIMEFHRTFCPNQIGSAPSTPTDDVRDLRIRLIKEEVVKELLPALESGDLIGIADGCIDGIVVLMGTLIAYGMPFDELWREVQRSNMAKGTPQPDGTILVKRRPDGKILKPDGWQPPDIGFILAQASASPPPNAWHKPAMADLTPDWDPQP